MKRIWWAEYTLRKNLLAIKNKNKRPKKVKTEYIIEEYAFLSDDTEEEKTKKNEGYSFIESSDEENLKNKNKNNNSKNNNEVELEEFAFLSDSD